MSEVKAPIQTSYRVRLLIIGLIMLFFGGYFAYDGWVGYPKENERVQAYLDLKNDLGQVPDEDWREVAEANGWPTKNPGEELHTEGDMLAQKVLFVVLMVVSAWFLFAWIVAAKRYTLLNEEGVGDHKGRFIKFDEIKDLDLRRWDTKGIAIVQGENGQRVVLDDWKMATTETREMIDVLRAKLGLEDPNAADEDAEAMAEGEEAAGEADTPAVESGDTDGETTEKPVA